jgi:hypothetical protein
MPLPAVITAVFAAMIPASAAGLLTAHERRGAADRGEHRQGVGAVAKAVIYLTKIKVLSAPVNKFSQVELGIKLKVI